MADYPLVYIISFLWFEPLLVFAGAVQAVLDPRQLLHLSLPHVDYHPSMYPLMLGMAGSWLVLMYQKSVTLRKWADIEVWRDITIAHTISDVIYLYAYIYDVGLLRFVNPTQWTVGDWITIWTSVPPLAIKLCFLAGVGLTHNSGPQAHIQSVSLPGDEEA